MVMPHAAAASPPSYTTPSSSTRTTQNRDDLTRSAPLGTSCYSVHADLDPGLLQRLIQLIAKRGMVPTSLHAVQSVAADGQVEFVVDLQVDGLPEMTAEMVAESMRQIPGVSFVYFAMVGTR